MKLNAKKIAKIVTLLITSLLIGFASAQTYSELFMHGTPITIGTAGVKFTNGNDTLTISTGGINSMGTEVTFDNITAIEPGEARTYVQAVNITNTAGATKTINISLYSLTGKLSANFEYLNITLLDGTGAAKGDNITLSGSGNATETQGQQIPNNGVWSVRWIIKAKTTATESDSISVTLRVKVE